MIWGDLVGALPATDRKDKSVNELPGGVLLLADEVAVIADWQCALMLGDDD